MRYAMIENGTIINTIEAQPEFAEALGAVLLEQGFGIGDTYRDGRFIRRPQPEEAESVPEPTELEQLRADVDYIAMETGVEL